MTTHQRVTSKDAKLNQTVAVLGRHRTSADATVTAIRRGSVTISLPTWSGRKVWTIPDTGWEDGSTYLVAAE